jgi:single-strand DNA-binding protein
MKRVQINKLATMNHVNLIGTMVSTPRLIETENGKKTVQFSLATQEPYLDENGKTKIRKQWHRISAWGTYGTLITELGEKGLRLAIEGRLVSKFYQTASGQRTMISEVEVNDMVLI